MSFQKRRGFNSFKTFKPRGFIGAIGDDLPSLIPLVVSLLLFFSVFALALNTYNYKNLEFKKQLTVISVAKQIKQDSLLLNVQHFLDNCDDAKKTPLPYNFFAGVFPSDFDLTKIAHYVDEYGDFQAFNTDGVITGFSDKQDSPDYSGLKYSCKFIKIGARDLTEKSKNYSIRFYPIAVQTKLLISPSVYSDTYVIVPAIMVLVVWE